MMGGSVYVRESMGWTEVVPGQKGSEQKLVSLPFHGSL